MRQFGWTGKMNCLKFELNKMYSIEDTSYPCCGEKWAFVVERV